MDPTERAQLAVAEHYARRTRQLTAELAGAPWTANRSAYRALEIIARARRAELLDPDPLPHIERDAR